MGDSLKGLRIKAHAKINPILRVGELRSDGYHEVWTKLLAVELHDTIEIVRDSTTKLLCTIGDLSGEANLAWKALRLLSEWLEIPPIHVLIEKNIPTEAGLGGASSDAAAVLYGVHLMMGQPLGPTDLAEIGIACGSDVPFFLARRPAAIATGRGEKLQFIEPPPAESILIAKPHIGHKTKEMYAKLPDRAQKPFPPPEVEPHNDFESVASPESRALMERLGAHLTGSGSAVWVRTKAAHAIAEQLKNEGFWAVATRTLERFEEPEWI